MGRAGIDRCVFPRAIGKIDAGKTRGECNATPKIRPTSESKSRSLSCDVPEHVGVARAARVDKNDIAESEGIAPVRGATDYPGESRYRREPEVGVCEASGSVECREAVRGAGTALSGKTGWVCPNHQVRLSGGRPGSNGVCGAGRSGCRRGCRRRRVVEALAFCRGRPSGVGVCDVEPGLPFRGWPARAWLS